MTVDREPDFDLAYESDPDEVDQPSASDQDLLVEPLDLPSTVRPGDVMVGGDEADTLEQAREVALDEDEDR